MYAIRLQDQDVQYINELYKSSHGYVKIWNGKNRGGAFIPANYMCRNDVEDTIIRNGIYNSMREDMLTLPKGTIPSKQIMTRFQNRLKAKRLRENYSGDLSVRWKSRGLW